MIRFISIISLFIVCTVYAQDIQRIEQLFPADNQIEGWVVKDSIETFIGDDLFYFINGGADVYLEYGFIKVAHANYSNSEGAKIHLEIYEMEDSHAGFGIYSLNSSGAGSKIDLGEEGLLYDYYLHYFKGRYYVRCTASGKDKNLVDTLKNFGIFIDDLIVQEGKKPSLLLAIELKEFQPSQIKYFEGQLALNNVFNFGHGSVAAFNEGLSAESGDKMAFVFAYKNDYKCREWFASAKGKMQMSKKFFDYTVNDDGFTVKDKAEMFFSFKPFGRFFIVLKGYKWEEAQPIFDKMKLNLEKVGD